MGILNSKLAEIRNTQKGTGSNAATGFISQVKIGDNLYKVKDAAVEDLAAYIETEYKVRDLQTTSATASTYLSGVSLGADGKISFTTGTIASVDVPIQSVDNTSAAGKYVSYIYKDGTIVKSNLVDIPVIGVTTYTATAGQYVSGINLTDRNVTVTTAEIPVQTVDDTAAAGKYVSYIYLDGTEVKSNLVDIPVKSVSGATDATKTQDLAYTLVSTANNAVTLTATYLSASGVKLSEQIANIDNLKEGDTVQAAIGEVYSELKSLVGGDFDYAYTYVKAIIEELGSGTEGSSLLNTVVDTWRTEMPKMVKVENDSNLTANKVIIGAGGKLEKASTIDIDDVVTASSDLTTTGIIMGDGSKGIASSSYTISADSALTTSATTVVPTASAVASYVQGKINTINSTIADLDATVSSYDGTPDAANPVKVTVTQVNGAITGVTVADHIGTATNHIAYTNYNASTELIEFSLNTVFVPQA